MGKHNGRSRNKLVPGCEEALERMKYEIAAELGLPFGSSFGGSRMAGGPDAADAEFAAEPGTVPGAVPGDGAGQAAGARLDWGSVTAREAGAVGGHITQRLVRMAQQLPV